MRTYKLILRNTKQRVPVRYAGMDETFTLARRTHFNVIGIMI